MRIQLTVDVDDELRMAIAQRLGYKGRADRPTILAHLNSLIDADLDDVRFDYTMSKECPSYERAEA